MNQGKLEVVKQEMARVNVNILGISELKWTEMGEFNSDDHYIYYCGQESLRRNGVAIMVNKRVRNAVQRYMYIYICKQHNHSENTSTFFPATRRLDFTIHVETSKTIQENTKNLEQQQRKLALLDVKTYKKASKIKIV